MIRYNPSPWVKASPRAMADPPRLLSVEDNKETRLLLKHGLKDFYEVNFASDVEEALDTAEVKDFDLLLLDINLGTEREQEGVDLLHKLREREDIGPVPAVALTAYAMPGDRKDLLNEGFDEYVAKPFTFA